MIRVTSAVLVAMLCLASARSLVPGLCATQAALDARAASCTTTCCERPSQPVEDDRPVVRADAKVECAFCKLTTTLVETPNAVAIQVGAVPAIPRQQPLDSLALVESIDQAHAGRAPPAMFLV